MNSAASTSAIPIQQQQQSHLPLPPSTAEHLLRAAATASQDQDMAGINHTAAVARPLELPRKRKLPNNDAENQSHQRKRGAKATEGDGALDRVILLLERNEFRQSENLKVVETVFSLVHTASMDREKENRENTARMAKLEEMVSTLQQAVEKVLTGLGNVTGKPVWAGEPTPTISTEQDPAETTTLSTSAKGKAKASPPLPPPARSDIARQPIASTSANDGSELSREHIPSTRPGEEGVYYMSPYMAAAVAEMHPRSAPPNIEVFPMYSQIESLFSARPPPLPQSHPNPFSAASKPSAPKKARTVPPPSKQKDLATTTTTTTTTTTSAPTSPSALEEKPPTFMMSRKVSKVTDLWLEYSEGLNGLPSVFSQYVAPAPPGQGSMKKNNFPSETERKHFQRRRIILEEVERLSNVHGIEPKIASERLENFRLQRGYSLQKLQGVIKDGTLTVDL